MDPDIHFTYHETKAFYLRFEITNDQVLVIAFDLFITLLGLFFFNLSPSFPPWSKLYNLTTCLQITEKVSQTHSLTSWSLIIMWCQFFSQLQPASDETMKLLTLFLSIQSGGQEQDPMYLINPCPQNKKTLEKLFRFNSIVFNSGTKLGLNGGF